MIAAFSSREEGSEDSEGMVKINYVKKALVIQCLESRDWSMASHTRVRYGKQVALAIEIYESGRSVIDMPLIFSRQASTRGWESKSYRLSLHHHWLHAIFAEMKSKIWP